MLNIQPVESCMFCSMARISVFCQDVWITLGDLLMIVYVFGACCKRGEPAMSTPKARQPGLSIYFDLCRSCKVRTKVLHTQGRFYNLLVFYTDVLARGCTVQCYTL